MKRTLIALALVAIAGCSGLPESFRQSQDVASMPPPASPYGN